MAHSGTYIERQSKTGTTLALALPDDNEIELSQNDKIKLHESNNVDVHFQSGAEKSLMIYENCKSEELMQKEQMESE
eukprot:c41597_g1_i1 orf=3-233(+)